MISGVMIDSREPESIQRLDFGVPSAVLEMETGDLQAVADDGKIILVERKTPEDFLNSLRDDRLLLQIGRMSMIRYEEQLSVSSYQTTWPYLVITGEFRRDRQGKVLTNDRGMTGWDWSALQGALITIQEMGVPVVQCAEGEYVETIQRLGNRERKPLEILPPRPPSILGAGVVLLTCLPGVGLERAKKLMEWSGNCPGQALAAVTDLAHIDRCPLSLGARQKIRGILGLKDNEFMEVSYHV